MSEHTPTPWFAAQDSTIADSNMKMIGGMESYRDAEHIVRCVNAHDELVAALERFMSLYRDDVTDAMSDAEFALALARGEQP